MTDDRNDNHSDSQDTNDSPSSESSSINHAELLAQLEARRLKETMSSFVCKLAKTTRLSEIQDPTWQAILSSYYGRPHEGRFHSGAERSRRAFATILNAAYTQGQSTFLLSADLLDELLAADQKVQGRFVRHLASMSGDWFKQLIAVAKQHGWFVKVHAPPQGSQLAAVFEIVDPLIRPMLDAKYGRDILEAQRERVKQYAARNDRLEAPSEEQEEGFSADLSGVLSADSSAKSSKSDSPPGPHLHQDRQADKSDIPSTSKSQQPTVRSMGPSNEGEGSVPSGARSEDAEPAGSSAAVQGDQPPGDRLDPFAEKIHLELQFKVRDINRLMLPSGWNETPYSPELYVLGYVRQFGNEEEFLKTCTKEAQQRYGSDSVENVVRFILREAAKSFANRIRGFEGKIRNYKSNGSPPIANVVDELLDQAHWWGILPLDTIREVLRVYFGEMRVKKPDLTYKWNEIEGAYLREIEVAWVAKVARFRAVYDAVFWQRWDQNKPSGA